MRDLMVTGYILVWPLLVLVMMGVMGRGLVRDWLQARHSGEDLV